jgi:hypothetical protein
MGSVLFGAFLLGEQKIFIVEASDFL